MSAGLQLIRAIIDNGSRDIFRGLNPTYFTEDEQGPWAFVSGYFDRYGVLPTPEVCQQNGLYLPDAPGPIQYFRDNLRNRTIYNIYLRDQQSLMECLGRQDMANFVAMLSAMVSEMQAMETARDTFTLAEAMQMVMEDFEDARANPGMRGVPYGFETLDEVTGGARAGDLNSIVARPGLGKTYTLVKMACAAWSAGNSICLVSNEMGAVEIARRILAMGSGVSADFIQRGHVSAWGEEQLRASVERIGQMPPFHLLIGDLKKSVRDVDAVLSEHEPDACYVDAGYLLKPSRDKALTKRFEMASEAMRELKGLATSRHKPVVQTVQFNRGQKDDEEMNLANIGQTDEVGQLSATVVGMRKGASPYETSRREYRVIKNRHGSDGITFVTRFEHSPFCMDEVNDDAGPGVDEDGNWDGTQGAAPTRDEWSAV